MAKNMTLTEYINLVGASEVADSLGVERASVYYWRDLKTAPTPHNAHKLIEHSHGVLTWSSIYEPFIFNAPERQEPA